MTLEELTKHELIDLLKSEVTPNSNPHYVYEILCEILDRMED